MMPVTFDAAENEPIMSRTVGVTDQLALEMFEIDVSVGVLVDDHHVGDRLAPRQLVGVVLVRSDEHHRAILGSGSTHRTR